MIQPVYVTQHAQQHSIGALLWFCCDEQQPSKASYFHLSLRHQVSTYISGQLTWWVLGM
jgi:hypothetical protein